MLPFCICAFGNEGDNTLLLIEKEALLGKSNNIIHRPDFAFLLHLIFFK